MKKTITLELFYPPLDMPLCYENAGNKYSNALLICTKDSSYFVGFYSEFDEVWFSYTDMGYETEEVLFWTYLEILDKKK